ncbi:MAG: hypothetical protein ACREQT_06980 [Candidatus Binataceae bacterium]
MEIKTLKGSKLIIFACVLELLPGIHAYRHLMVLSSFWPHPIGYALHVVTVLGDFGSRFVCAVTALCEVSRWRHTAVITDAGIQASGSLEPMRWAEVVSMKRVRFFGGIDIFDRQGSVRLRLPYSYLGFNQLAQIMSEKLAGCDNGIALALEFWPKFGWWFGLPVYFICGSCLFIAYAAVLERRYVLAAFAAIFSITVAICPRLVRRIRIQISRDSVNIRGPFSVSTVRFADVAKVELLATTGLLLFVSLRRNDLSSVAFTDDGRAAVRMYRAVTTAWARWKKDQMLGSVR